jgi:uncharacterized zinc-type alcohol dehydrogenase-like protein
MTGTYNSYERGTKIPTYGGYSALPLKNILYISDKLELSGVYYAESPPFSITSFVGKGHKVGVLGLGGLGHMAASLQLFWCRGNYVKPFAIERGRC